MTKNGNDTRILFITTLNEKGYRDSWGKISKKLILNPNGITEAIPVNSFTSPPPHTFNCHIIYVIVYVITTEIIEAKMYLMLEENKDKIKFDEIPKIRRILVNELGTIPLRTSKIAAIAQNNTVIDIWTKNTIPKFIIIV